MNQSLVMLVNNILRPIKGIKALLIHLVILLGIFIFSSREFTVTEAEWSKYILNIILFYFIPGLALIKLLKWETSFSIWFPVSISFGFFLQGSLFIWLTYFNIQRLILVFQYLTLIISVLYIFYLLKRNKFNDKGNFTLHHFILYSIVFSIIWIISGYFGLLNSPEGLYSHVFERHTTNAAEKMLSMRFGYPLHLDNKLISASHNGFFLSTLSVLSSFSSDNIAFSLYVFWPLCYLAKMLIAYHIGKKMDSEILGLLFALFVGSLLFHFNLYHGINHILFSVPISPKLGFFHYNVVSFSHWLMLLIVLTLLFALKQGLKRNYLLAGFLVSCLMLSRTQTMLPFCAGMILFIFIEFAFYRNRNILIIIPFIILGFVLYVNLSFGTVDGPAGKYASMLYDPFRHLKSDINGLKYLVGTDIFSNTPNLLTLFYALLTMTLRWSGIGLLGFIGIIKLFENSKLRNNYNELSIHSLILCTLLASIFFGMFLFLNDGAWSFLYVLTPYFLFMNFYAAWFLKNSKIIAYFIITMMVAGIIFKPWMVGSLKKLVPTQTKEEWGTLSPIKNFQHVNSNLRLVSSYTEKNNIILWLLSERNIQPHYSEKVLCRMISGRICYALPITKEIDKIEMLIDKYDINILFSFSPVDPVIITNLEQAGFSIDRIEISVNDKLSLYKIRRSL